MVVSKRTYAALALLMALALSYWLWYGLHGRSIHRDDVTSILAAKGILEHGLQYLPSGYLYHRGYVPHLFLAAIIGVFGVNSLSIMIPSLLAGLGSLWLVFLLAKDVTGRPWVGVAVVAALIMLRLELVYATNPRFYIFLQFFTLLAAYSAWRGYVKGSVRYQILTFLAVIAAIMSHRQGIALPVAIPISVILVLRMTGRSWPSVPVVWTVAGVLMVAAAAAYMVLYRPPSTTPLVTASLDVTPGIAASLVTSNPDISGLVKRVLEPQRAALYGLSLMPLLAFVAIGAVRRGWSEVTPGSVYLLSMFTGSFLLLILATGRTDGRLWLFIVPFYLLLLGSGAAAVLRRYAPRAAEYARRRPARTSVTTALIAGLGFTALGIGSVAFGGEYVQRAIREVVPQCLYGACSKPLVEGQYKALRSVVKPEDVVISSTPHVTHYYLGRVDGYLREKVIISGDEATRVEDLRDEYFGIPLIDASDLRRLLGENESVWVITDSRTELLSSRETIEVLENEYYQYLQNRLLTTYVSCTVPSCGLAKVR